MKKQLLAIVLLSNFVSGIGLKVCYSSNERGLISCHRQAKKLKEEGRLF